MVYNGIAVALETNKDCQHSSRTVSRRRLGENHRFHLAPVCFCKWVICCFSLVLSFSSGLAATFECFRRLMLDFILHSQTLGAEAAVCVNSSNYLWEQWCTLESGSLPNIHKHTPSLLLQQKLWLEQAATFQTLEKLHKPKPKHQPSSSRMKLHQLTFISILIQHFVSESLQATSPGSQRRAGGSTAPNNWRWNTEETTGRTGHLQTVTRERVDWRKNEEYRNQTVIWNHSNNKVKGQSGCRGDLPPSTVHGTACWGRCRGRV